jgi:hypothetical protein
MATKSQVMRRAWAIFRQTYCYPQIKFARIGRACFGYCLRRAWAEARKAAQTAAATFVDKFRRAAALLVAIEREQFNEHWTSARTNIAAMRSELSQLS